MPDPTRLGQRHRPQRRAHQRAHLHSARPEPVDQDPDRAHQGEADHRRQCREHTDRRHRDAEYLVEIDHEEGQHQPDAQRVDGDADQHQLGDAGQRGRW